MRLWGGCNEWLFPNPLEGKALMDCIARARTHTAARIVHLQYPDSRCSEKESKTARHLEGEAVGRAISLPSPDFPGALPDSPGQWTPLIHAPGKGVRPGLGAMPVGGVRLGSGAVR